MPTLTEDARQKVAEIAERHGVSVEATVHLLSAIAAGDGRQAQFNHPELGGMGQWSEGGLIMIGDMFNQRLKAQVADLCGDLAQVWQGTAVFAEEVPLRSPSTDAKSAKLFMLAAFGQRWPAELGAPAAAGSQNDMHYAIFPGSRRLAIERNGQITVYDTQDHRIGGVSQQQGGEQSLRFTSQSGPVSLSDLQIVSPISEAAGDEQAPSQATELPKPGSVSDDEIFSRLERLADLRNRDIITPEEFAAKKAELLARL